MVKIKTSVGVLKIEFDGDQVIAINKSKGKEVPPSTSFQEKVAIEILDYLSGKRKKFSFKTKQKGTEFQQLVWTHLKSIKFGECQTYSQVAHAIGKPRAVRAVGTACGRNQLLLAVPCHRVTAKSGLGGFALGLPVKSQLLALESNI